jgi:hypothetical protein
MRHAPAPLTDNTAATHLEFRTSAAPAAAAALQCAAPQLTRADLSTAQCPAKALQVLLNNPRSDIGRDPNQILDNMAVIMQLLLHHRHLVLLLLLLLSRELLHHDDQDSSGHITRLDAQTEHSDQRVIR